MALGPLSLLFLSGTRSFRNVLSLLPFFIGKPDQCPEISRKEEYGFGIDVWSAGVIFYEMLCGKISHGIMSENFELPEEISKASGEILRKMLKENKKERATAEEIYEFILGHWKQEELEEKTLIFEEEKPKGKVTGISSDAEGPVDSQIKGIPSYPSLSENQETQKETRMSLEGEKSD